MDDADKTGPYEPPRLEAIGSLHDLTQAVAGSKVNGPFTDAFNRPTDAVQVS